MVTKHVCTYPRFASQKDLGAGGGKFAFTMSGFLYVPAVTEALIKGADDVVEEVYVREKSWLPPNSKVLELDRTLRQRYSHIAVALPLSEGWNSSNWGTAGADNVVSTLRLFESDLEANPPVKFPLEVGDYGYELPQELQKLRCRMAELSRFAVRFEWQGRKASLGLYRAAYTMSRGRFIAWIMTANWNVVQRLWRAGIYPIVLSGPEQFYGESESIFCYMPIADVAAALHWVNTPGYEIFTGRRGRRTAAYSKKGRDHFLRAFRSVRQHLGLLGVLRWAVRLATIPRVRKKSAALLL